MDGKDHANVHNPTPVAEQSAVAVVNATVVANPREPRQHEDEEKSLDDELSELTTKLIATGQETTLTASDSEELLFLVHEHLQAKGYGEIASNLLKEAQVTPLPSSASPSILEMLYYVGLKIGYDNNA